MSDLNSLAKYAEGLKRQIQTPSKKHDSPQAQQAMREFLERDLTKTLNKIENIKLNAPAKK